MCWLPCRYNDNPHSAFGGNVDGPTGGIQDYGVYAGPILDGLEQLTGFVPGRGGGVDGNQDSRRPGQPCYCLGNL